MALLNVVSNAELTRRETEDATNAEMAALAAQSFDTEFTDQLAKHVRDRYWAFHRHQTRTGIRERLLAAQRAFNGEYDPSKKAQIQKFGGSDVYARLTAIKCRGASALLRDVFLSGDRPWGISPTPVPDIPDDIKDQVEQLVAMEAQELIMAGQPVDPELVKQRREQLLRAARSAAEKNARRAAQSDEKLLQDKLVEGGFYDALADFLMDMAIFPFAVLKGPFISVVQQLDWEDGVPAVEVEPIMAWQRVSPFDIYWTPGASSIEEADIIERRRFRRSDLQSLIDVPGFDSKAIRSALEDYTNGHYDFYESTDTEQADNEDKENPHLNESYLISGLEYQGEIQGKYLLAWNNGEVARKVKNFDPVLDYHVTAWMAGRWCIKAQIQPHPKRRHNYFSTSFEKVPGSVTGHGLPEILNDAQHVANAAFRSLVNNMGLASGPQVALNEDLIVAGSDTTLFPWKQWRFQSDPLGNNSQKPIEFFQPNSNASELIGVFDKMMLLADEVSGIPRYMTGNQNVSGAASTASGLNQLMNNASKVLQQAAAQVDGDVLETTLEYLYFLLVLTEPESLMSGRDAQIVAKGVTMAMAREADRQRQLEFLQLTANPLDSGIVGPERRAHILRQLATNLGLDGANVVPSEDELAAMQQQQAAMMQQAAAAQGAQPESPGATDNRPNRGLDNAQRARSPAAIQRQMTP